MDGWQLSTERSISSIEEMGQSFRHRDHFQSFLQFPSKCPNQGRSRKKTKGNGSIEAVSSLCGPRRIFQYKNAPSISNCISSTAEFSPTTTMKVSDSRPVSELDRFLLIIDLVPFFVLQHEQFFVVAALFAVAAANSAYPAPAYPAKAYAAPAYPAKAYPAPAYPAPAYPEKAYAAPAYTAPKYDYVSLPQAFFSVHTRKKTDGGR